AVAAARVGQAGGVGQLAAEQTSVADQMLFVFFFLSDSARPDIYTLSLHDALPISRPAVEALGATAIAGDVTDPAAWARAAGGVRDRKSTRLNSSHVSISYAVFCLKKKKNTHSSRRTIRKQTSSNLSTTQRPSRYAR